MEPQRPTHEADIMLIRAEGSTGINTWAAAPFQQRSAGVLWLIAARRLGCTPRRRPALSGKRRVAVIVTTMLPLVCSEDNSGNVEYTISDGTLVIWDFNQQRSEMQFYKAVRSSAV